MATIKGKVIRQLSRLRGTPGDVVLENGFGSNTLELPWMNNERGRSCTAPGLEKGRVWWSPHLLRPVIRFEDRNGRQDCLVHNGNWAGEDRGQVTQIHGCTEVGRGYGDIARPASLGGGTQWGIMHSGDTLTALIASLRDDEFDGESTVSLAGYITGYHDVEIEYAWDAGAEPTGPYTLE